MKRLRKVGGAMAVAVTVAVMMGVGSARLEAKGNKGDGRAAICSYLTSVIEYPGVNATILAFALSLYNYYDCAAS